MVSVACLRPAHSAAVKYWPGIFLAGTIAAAANFISAHYGAPVMLLALLVGMGFNFLVEDESRCVAGIELSSKTLLRAGVALLGIRISVSEFVAFGWRGMLIVTCLVALTIGSGLVVARLFKKRWRFGLLTGGAVAICGASAALAISAVIARDEEDESDTLFTVITVTTLSTVAMILYPILFGVFGLSDSGIGFLLGATIHDVAQVVGAGFSVSQEAGEAATVTKLFRVALLPVVLMIILAVARVGSKSGGIPKLPTFLVVFVCLALINSLITLPSPIVDASTIVSRVLLVTAIAALGIKTSLRTMLGMGGQKIGTVVAATLFLLGGASLAMALGLV